MRFRIEYLRETAEQDSVCHSRSLADHNLLLVSLQAHAWSGRPRTKFGAGGFQVRDLDNGGRVIAMETFDGPVQSVH
jgi:hypothetical protein